MTKTEIIRNVASATGESIKTTETVVLMLFESSCCSISDG